MQRAFLYGDLLFESMLGVAGRIPHSERHFRRLAHSAQILSMDLCGLNAEKFSRESEAKLVEFMQSNPGSNRCRVRFVLNRKGGGLYLPDDFSSEYEIQVEPLQSPPINSVLNVGVFKLQQKAPGPLSNLKNGNALVYVMARIWAKEHQLNDALIINTSNEIIEASSSNIFWKAGGQWYTPPLASGCVAGIGREIFMEGHPVIEKPCFEPDLLQAEERLLTNALLQPRMFAF